VMVLRWMLLVLLALEVAGQTQPAVSIQVRPQVGGRPIRDGQVTTVYLAPRYATAIRMVALVLAGIALRREGTTFSVGGGGFSKWMFWAIVMITLPQVFGWFAFWGVGAPLPSGGIGNGWMSTFSNDATIFVNTLVIGRLVPVLAAMDGAAFGSRFQRRIHPPLASILGAMFLLAIPATASLLQGWNDGTRFVTAAVLEGAWTYTASRIMPIAAGLAVIGAIINFAFGRPAIRLIGCAGAFLTVSALWKLVVSMM
jgi:hypothetical protein